MHIGEQAHKIVSPTQSCMFADLLLACPLSTTVKILLSHAGWWQAPHYQDDVFTRKQCWIETTPICILHMRVKKIKDLGLFESKGLKQINLFYVIAYFSLDSG